ncbi:MAG: CoB--CoM heterodisulfide reductase iron-sulfur subunit B family protein [Chloroflexi bacterium]|nr:CoB--CoM heterodisulfide reductase iron-sulfur subunit B family protein [Chloroflexota bacterium]
MGRSSFSYYPGCTAKSSAREYDLSTRICCEALGIKLHELADWSCCGASSAHSTNDLISIALPARDLNLASRTGEPLATSCAMCYSRLKIAAGELEDPGKRRLVAEALGEDVQPAPEVFHILQLLDGNLEKIAVSKPLSTLKVACYYGCLLVRPARNAIDDCENPQVMDRMARKLGADPVQWAFKTECCGAGMPLARPDMVLRLSHKILAQAAKAGAECIVVACPECHANLDMHQKEMPGYGDGASLPVVYVTQLLGLALGNPAKRLGLAKHVTDVMPLLRRKGLA